MRSCRAAASASLLDRDRLSRCLAEAAESVISSAAATSWMASPTDLKTVIASAGRVAAQSAVDAADLHEAVLRRRIRARSRRRRRRPPPSRPLASRSPRAPHARRARAEARPCRAETRRCRSRACPGEPMRPRRPARDEVVAQQTMSASRTAASAIRRGSTSMPVRSAMRAANAFAPLGVAGVDERPPDRPGGEHRPELPLGLAARADDRDRRGVGARQQPGGRHRTRRRCASRSPSRRRAAPAAARSRRRARRRGPGSSAGRAPRWRGMTVTSFTLAPAPPSRTPGMSSRSPFEQLDVRAERRAIAAGRDVAVGGLDRVEHVGDRHGGADRGRRRGTEGRRGRHRCSA